MTDKERILFKIIQRMSLTYSHKLEWGKEYEGVHFAPWKGSLLIDGKLQVGMLVLCQGSGIHDWTIGYTVEKLYDDYSGWIIRELDSDRLCKVSNDSFVPIEGLSNIDLLVKEDYVFYQKILKAFRRGGENWYRFGGIDIIEKRKWKIFIREKWGGIDGESKPFYFIIKWNKKTSIKYILQKMVETGYGTRKFEKILKEK